MKHVKELRKFLERRHYVKVRLAPEYQAAHPALICRAEGRTVTVKVSGSPSDSKRDALNTERTMKVAFRQLGVELERKS